MSTSPTLSNAATPATDVARLLRDALVLRNAGKFDLAERLYRRAVDQDPDNGEIHYLLGCLYVNSGNYDAGIAALEDAARLMPRSANPDTVLGKVYHSLGRWNECVEAYANACERAPDLLDLRLDLAAALSHSGRITEAEELFNQILTIHPRHAEAQSRFADHLNGLKQFAEAETYARRAADIDPLHASAKHNLAVALVGLDRMMEAETASLRAIELDPGLPQGHWSLIQVRRSQKRRNEAEQAARRALRILPNDVNLLDAIGMCEIELELPREATPYFERAVRTDPNRSDVYRHLAYACSLSGAYEDAIAYGSKEVEIAPSPLARYNLSLDQIRTGRYLEGWSNYQSHEEWIDRDGPPPKWDGTALEGRSLLVYNSGGIGDAIQFVRFLPPVAERARGHVAFACPAGLMEILGDIPGIERHIPQEVGRSLPREPFDVYVNLLHLPAVLKTTEETLPTAKTPITVPDDAIAIWRKRLAGVCGLKVGLCWAGDPSYFDDHNRSMRLDCFAPLASVEGVSLVSLQVGAPADEVRSGTHGLAILDAPELLSPLSKTAALIRELDIVMSVDTAIAHLAGALGVETWLLLAFVPHWIWNVYRPNDTPWYPRHRLFRQHRPKDWSAVIERVTQELAQRVADPR